MSADSFKTGTIFRHGSWIEEDRSPAICRVTAVRNGLVYYGFGPGATKGRYTQTAAKLIANGAEVVTVGGKAA